MARAQHRLHGLARLEHAQPPAGAAVRTDAEAGVLAQLLVAARQVVDERRAEDGGVLRTVGLACWMWARRGAAGVASLPPGAPG